MTVVKYPRFHPQGPCRRCRRMNLPCITTAVGHRRSCDRCYLTGPSGTKCVFENEPSAKSNLRSTSVKSETKTTKGEEKQVNTDDSCFQGGGDIARGIRSEVIRLENRLEAMDTQLKSVHMWVWEIREQLKQAVNCKPVSEDKL
ncbi:hypothetical protein AMATHDRAFT_5652 [Amanita thiersii Skay4041]|uniref:Zn(2)-C6 fungal-type domain-containing protein n=1 Tax=Amanita thiersii Skay4041 TaxID=703135 RepID=A0A2A9NC76_9AGAR|nr:hypothetical protein AMATHDRAFT_5652 [Amanita thiersii Skay4041]